MSSRVSKDCQTVNRFAKITGTENFNSYTERPRGNQAPQSSLPTPEGSHKIDLDGA